MLGIPITMSAILGKWFRQLPENSAESVRLMGSAAALELNEPSVTSY